MAVKSSDKKRGQWIKQISLYLLLFITAGWGVDYWRALSMASGAAPALVVTPVQGEEIDLLALSQEKPVLVYFWATWCGVCSLEHHIV